MESFGWDLKQWWNLLGAAGALLAIASAPVQFVPGVLMGVSIPRQSRGLYELGRSKRLSESLTRPQLCWAT